MPGKRFSSCDFFLVSLIVHFQRTFPGARPPKYVAAGAYILCHCHTLRFDSWGTVAQVGDTPGTSPCSGIIILTRRLRLIVIPNCVLYRPNNCYRTCHILILFTYGKSVALDFSLPALCVSTQTLAMDVFSCSARQLRGIFWLRLNSHVALSTVLGTQTFQWRCYLQLYSGKMQLNTTYVSTIFVVSVLTKVKECV